MENKVFDRVIGYENIKLELTRLLDRLRSPEKYEKLGVTQPHGLLLHGEPGVGKSTIAQCFLDACDRKVFVCRKDRSNGDFVNHIRNVFDQALQEAPSVILLDDMDKFSNEDMAHRDAEEYVTVQSCIDDVHGKPVFVIATANDMHKLPDSLVRAGRFDHVIQVKTPKDKDAEAIVAHYLKRKSYVADLDTFRIARLLDGRSCAELETVINEAGVYAGFAGRDQITMDDMVRSYLRVVYEAPECIDEDENSMTAVAIHEAGHAVVSELLEPGSVNLVSVGGHDGSTGGITSLHRRQDYFKSLRPMENRVMVLLAGRAATELCLGQVDTGAGQDLDRARHILSRFVADYCAYGFDFIDNSAHNSQDLTARQENRIAADLSSYYQQVKRLLSANRPFLDLLVKRLVKEKILLADQVAAIREESTAR